MANKRFEEDFLEFTSRPNSDDMFLVLTDIDKKTYKTKRSELFSNVNVAYTVFQFAKNTSQTSAPTIGWTETPPITTNSEWLWMRQRKKLRLRHHYPYDLLP